MIIALDIDGTITRHPEFFAFISQALIRGGHQVIIITFREDRITTAEDLAAWGIAYSSLLTWSSTQNDLAGMDAWKGKMCEQLNANMLFEDDPKVLRHLGPTIVGMLVVDHEIHDLTKLEPDEPA